MTLWFGSGGIWGNQSHPSHNKHNLSSSHLLTSLIALLPYPSASMAPALPGIYKAIFVYLEPILTVGGAYASYTSPEWFLTRLIPGDTNTGLIHTSETILAIRLYAVLLLLLAGISISVFTAVGGKEDKLAMSVTRRLLFVLAGNSLSVY